MRWPGGLLVMLALFSVSTSSLVVRHLVDVPAIVIAFWRMFIAGALLWGFSFFATKEKLNQKNKLNVLGAGIFLGFHFALFFGAVKLTSISSATLLGTLAPLFTALYGRVFQKRVLAKKVFFGLLLSLLGIVIVSGFPLTAQNDHFVGNVMAILGSLFLALAWILAEKVRQTTSAVVYSRSVFLIAASVLFLLSLMRSESIFIVETESFLWFMFLAVVPTLLGHLVLSYMVKYISPTVVASIPLGEPFIASVLGYFFFYELVPLTTLIGGGVTLFGLYYIIQGQVNRVFFLD